MSGAETHSQPVCKQKGDGDECPRKLESENEEEVDDDGMPSLEDADNEQNAVVGD
jgi:hypothetical protein